MSGAALQANTLYSIGPDSSFGAPQGFYSVSDTGSVWLFDLASVMLGFNGGLASVGGSGQFFAVGNDSVGNSSLISFTAGGGGAFSTIAPLGTGFVSGLAYDSADGYLYGISTDPMANSELKRISTSGSLTDVGPVGTGFYGGLTFDSDTGLLYGFAGDPFGVQRDLYSINPATGAAVFLFDLGDGSASFNGGLAYNSVDQTFSVLANSGMSVSTLHAFTLSGPASLTAGNAIGSGFVNGALANVSDVPEPCTTLPVAVGLLAGAICKRRRRKP